MTQAAIAYKFVSVGTQQVLHEWLRAMAIKYRCLHMGASGQALVTGYQGMPHKTFGLHQQDFTVKELALDLHVPQRHEAEGQHDNYQSITQHNSLAQHNHVTINKD
jgi:hypothetical protein